MSFGKLIPSIIPPLNDLLTFSLNNASLFLINSAASLFKGSLGLGSMNKKIRPRITALMPRTGFQSALRILRQTFP
jgi:hypothetical protein